MFVCFRCSLISVFVDVRCSVSRSTFEAMDTNRVLSPLPPARDCDADSISDITNATERPLYNARVLLTSCLNTCNFKSLEPKWLKEKLFPYLCRGFPLLGASLYIWTAGSRDSVETYTSVPWGQWRCGSVIRLCRGLPLKVFFVPLEPLLDGGEKCPLVNDQRLFYASPSSSMSSQCLSSSPMPHPQTCDTKSTVAPPPTRATLNLVPPPPSDVRH